jgi:peptide/nickel transport system substrate-binding protein
MRRWITALVMASVVALFVGASSATAGETGTLNVGFYIEPSTFDPHIAASQDVLIVWNVYEPLVGLHRDTLKTEPVLATSWQISPDQKVYTFKLRQGVKFHDGTTFNAAAVKASIERIKHFKRGPAWLVASVNEVRVVDEYTAQVVLNQPDIAFREGLPFIYMVSPAAIKQREQTAGDFAPQWFIDHSAGTGPYRIDHWARGEKLTLTKFDGYWRGWKRPHLSRIVYWSVLEAATQRLMLEKGDLDVALIYTADDVEAYRRNAAIAVDIKPSNEVMYIRLHMQAGPTKDKRVREALSYAFDWKAHEAVMRGQVAPSDGPVPAAFLDGWKPERIIRQYDIERAKKFLVEAGHNQGFKLTYLYNTGDEEKRIMGEVWRSGLQKLGIDLDIRVMSWPTLVQRLESPDSAEGSFALFTAPRIPDAYAFLYYMYHSQASRGTGRNFMRYSNPKVDDLIVRAAATAATDQRLKLYREATQLVVDDVPDIFTYRSPDIAIRRKVVQGYYHDPIYRRGLHYYDLYKTAP